MMAGAPGGLAVAAVQATGDVLAADGPAVFVADRLDEPFENNSLEDIGLFLEALDDLDIEFGNQDEVERRVREIRNEAD